MHEKNIIIKTKDGNLDCKTFINSNINAPTVIFYMDAPGIREELRVMCRRILKNGYWLSYRALDSASQFAKIEIL